MHKLTYARLVPLRESVPTHTDTHTHPCYLISIIFPTPLAWLYMAQQGISPTPSGNVCTNYLKQISMSNQSLAHGDGPEKIHGSLCQTRHKVAQGKPNHPSNTPAHIPQPHPKQYQKRTKVREGKTKVLQWQRQQNNRTAEL